MIGTKWKGGRIAVRLNSTVAIGFENKEQNIHALATYFLAGCHKYLKIQFILHKNTSILHYTNELVKAVLAKKKIDYAQTRTEHPNSLRWANFVFRVYLWLAKCILTIWRVGPPQNFSSYPTDRSERHGWLRHYAKIWEVPGSIPGMVIQVTYSSYPHSAALATILSS